MKKLAVLGFIMGMMYFTAEGFWRGWTNISMLFVGGLCAVLIGLLNEFPKRHKFKIWQQCLLGTLIIVSIEFVSGVVLNIWLKLNIWDYSKHYGNIRGQVCLTYTILWFIITPAVIWLDDWLRWEIFGEGAYYNLKQVYRDLIKLH
ncbi:putative ABC transporter permease [Candidatus Clostridium radicumherbarum]|uniref:ABC transporter permease n=1 Tax=Candidatus Clostridium radicumherbarum TaxID=3381662 RepID=A0ABW8TSJ4_9CLOT